MAHPGSAKHVSKKRSAGKSKLKPKRKRQSLDARLRKLTPDEQILKLLYGRYNPNDPAEQLAERARALRQIAEELKEKTRESEAFQHSLGDLKNRAVEPLLRDDAAFFQRLSKAMLRLRKPESKGAFITRQIRLVYLHELKQTGKVNLTRFSALLQKYWGVSISVRQLRRLARKYRGESVG